MKSEAPKVGRKQGIYNEGSLTSRFDALEKGEVLLLPDDATNLRQSCRVSAATLQKNNPALVFDISAWIAVNPEGETFKLIRVKRLK